MESYVCQIGSGTQQHGQFNRFIGFRNNQIILLRRLGAAYRNHRASRRARVKHAAAGNIHDLRIAGRICILRIAAGTTGVKNFLCLIRHCIDPGYDLMFFDHYIGGFNGISFVVALLRAFFTYIQAVNARLALPESVGERTTFSPSMYTSK